MLVLLCVQLVQTNNNESSWEEKKKKKKKSNVDKQEKKCKLVKKADTCLDHNSLVSQQNNDH
jgi:hypothetical protein